MARIKILSITMATLMIVVTAEVMRVDVDDEPPQPTLRRTARLQKLALELRSERAVPEHNKEVCFSPFAETGSPCLIPSTTTGGKRASSKFQCAPALPPCTVALDCEANPAGKVAVDDPKMIAGGYYCECQDGHPVLVRCPKLGWVPWEKKWSTFSAAGNQCE